MTTLEIFNECFTRIGDSRKATCDFCTDKNGDPTELTLYKTDGYVDSTKIRSHLGSEKCRNAQANACTDDQKAKIDKFLQTRLTGKDQIEVDENDEYANDRLILNLCFKSHDGDTTEAACKFCKGCDRKPSEVTVYDLNGDPDVESIKEHLGSEECRKAWRLKTSYFEKAQIAAYIGDDFYSYEKSISVLGICFGPVILHTRKVECYFCVDKNEKPIKITLFKKTGGLDYKASKTHMNSEGCCASRYLQCSNEDESEIGRYTGISQDAYKTKLEKGLKKMDVRISGRFLVESCFDPRIGDSKALACKTCKDSNGKAVEIVIYDRQDKLVYDRPKGNHLLSIMCYKSRKAVYSTEKQERINTCLGIDSTEYEQKLQEPVKKDSAVCACETVVKFNSKNDECNRRKWNNHNRYCDFYDECEAPFLDLDLKFFGQRLLPRVYFVQFDLKTEKFVFRADSTGVFYMILYVPNAMNRLTTPQKFIGSISIYFGHVEKLPGKSLKECFNIRRNGHEASGFLNRKKMWMLPIIEGQLQNTLFLEGLGIRGVLPTKRTKNRRSEARQLRDRSKDEAKAGYAMIATQTLDLFGRVKSYVGLEEHRDMVKLEIASLKAEKKKHSAYLKNLKKRL